MSLEDEIKEARHYAALADLETERRAFENWYEADAMPLEHSNWFRRDEDGDYELDDVRATWRGWLAKAERAN